MRYHLQDLALYPEFTISETLSYFGRLHGMTAAGVEGAAEALAQVLDLPAAQQRNTRLVKTLR